MVNSHSMHVGVVTLFPLIFGHLQQPDRIETILNILEDDTQLMSNFGIRSLSAKDQFSGVSPNSYRGNVFVHLNYLILKGLNGYITRNEIPAHLIERMKKLYTNIKDKVIDTVFKSW